MVASANSLPDSLLYPVKRVVENVEVILSISAFDKAQTYLELAEKRLNEAEAMVDIKNEKLVKESLTAMDINLKKAMKEGDNLTGDEKLEFFKKLTKFADHQQIVLKEMLGNVSELTGEAITCSLNLNQEAAGQASLTLKSLKRDFTKGEASLADESLTSATAEIEEKELTEEIESLAQEKGAGEVGLFKINLDVFSPNGDGIKDICKINVKATSGQNLWVDIFSKEGVLIRSNLKLAETLFSKGNYITSWNGKNNVRQPVSDGTYLFKLKGENGNYISLTTVAKIDNTAPAPPDLLAPKDEEIIYGAQVALYWSSSRDSDTEMYVLQYSQDPDFKEAKTTGDLGITVFVSKFSEGDWYWRVRSVDCAGNKGDYSIIRTFGINKRLIHSQTTNS